MRQHVRPAMAHRTTHPTVLLLLLLAASASAANSLLARTHWKLHPPVWVGSAAEPLSATASLRMSLTEQSFDHPVSAEVDALAGKVSNDSATGAPGQMATSLWGSIAPSRRNSQQEGIVQSPGPVFVLLIVVAALLLVQVWTGICLIRCRRKIESARAALNATSEGLLVIDSSGAVELYNRRLEEIWGFPKAPHRVRRADEFSAVCSSALEGSGTVSRSCSAIACRPSNHR